MCLLLAERLWFICLLLFEFFNLGYRSMIWYRKSGNASDSFNIYRWSLAISVRICIILITLESYRHRAVQAEIIKQLHKIDQIFAQKLSFQINYHRLKRSIFVAFFKWIAICTVVLLILIAAVLFEKAKVKDFIRLSLSFYPVLKKVLLASTYITYVILIKHRIQAMQHVFDRNSLLPHGSDSAFETQIGRESRSEIEAFELVQLIRLWQIFPRIHETIQMMNHIFKWPISMNFFVNLFDISVAIFHYLKKPSEYLLNFYNIFIASYLECAFLVYYVVCFGIIVQMASSIAKEAEKIAVKIHGISQSAMISEELQNFVSESNVL